MAELELLEDIAQAEILVIPMIDVSGSMKGDRIDSVNDAMHKVPEQLVEINDNEINSKLLVAPMEFGSGARWLVNQPVDPKVYAWRNVKAMGITDLGAAFRLLENKLTIIEKGGWIKGRGGAAPVLILVSDGEPTDDYQAPLKELKNRGWFKAALKFAIAVEGADKNVLAEFTGHVEAVHEVKDLMDLSAMVRAIIVSASKCASTSASPVAIINESAIVKDDGPTEINAHAQTEAIEAVKKAVDLTLNDLEDLF